MINSIIYFFVAAMASRWSRRWRHGGDFWGRWGLPSHEFPGQMVFVDPSENVLVSYSARVPSIIFAKKISGIAILSQSDGRAGLVTWEPFKASVWVLTAVKRWPTLRKPPSPTYRPPTGRQHARQRNRSTTLADAAVKPCSE